MVDGLSQKCGKLRAQCVQIGQIRIVYGLVSFVPVSKFGLDADCGGGNSFTSKHAQIEFDAPVLSLSYLNCKLILSVELAAIENTSLLTVLLSLARILSFSQIYD